MPQATDVLGGGANTTGTLGWGRVSVRSTVSMVESTSTIGADGVAGRDGKARSREGGVDFPQENKLTTTKPENAYSLRAFARAA
jgi:hypothetical protein